MRGVESVVVESRTREYCEQRVRAGVLEHDAAALLEQIGVGDRMRREALVHRGIFLRFGGRDHHIDFEHLTGGRTITVYGQHEVIKDLIAAALAANQRLMFEVSDVEVSDLTSTKPTLRFQHGGSSHDVQCDIIAGCDGFHGVCRPSIPAGVLSIYEKQYPFAWLGILAAAAPAADELIYSRHERGFALMSMRSPTITRLYFQCATDERLENWSDGQIWGELRSRFARDDAWSLNEGRILQRGITAMRSFVAEPMRFGRLFLVGDAAHIVPPTGAKGMNLAIADVRVLAAAIASFYDSGTTDLLDQYSATCLRRVWKVQRFSGWMTQMLHRSADDPFADSVHRAELEYVTSSRAAATALAENYVGLPFDGPGA
jgi:p-hydroxybenzoate 3-monooxygenase